MTVDVTVEAPAAPAQLFDLLAEIDRLQAEVRSAEDKAASLERALASSRRIGMAVGILMCHHQLTADQAIAILKSNSQRCNVKVRELAETVIYTGALGAVPAQDGGRRRPVLEPARDQGMAMGQDTLAALEMGEIAAFSGGHRGRGGRADHRPGPCPGPTGPDRRDRDRVAPG